MLESMASTWRAATFRVASKPEPKARLWMIEGIAGYGLDDADFVDALYRGFPEALLKEHFGLTTKL
jgi:hypothetical protein